MQIPTSDLSQNAYQLGHTKGPWRAVLYIPSKRATWPSKGEDDFLICESQTHSGPLIEIHSTIRNMKDVFGSCMGGHLAEIKPTHDGLAQAKRNAKAIAGIPLMIDYIRSKAIEGDSEAIAILTSILYIEKQEEES